MIFTMAALAAALQSEPVAAPAARIGDQSCQAWLTPSAASSPGLDDHPRMLAWAEGHASGAAALLGVDLLGQINQEGMSAWLDNYCRGHPLQHFSDAVVILEDDLARMKAAPSAPPAAAPK